MSKCPFWSSSRQNVDCYGECPMLIGENGKKQKADQCIFHECSPAIDISLKEDAKEDYGFLNLHLYDEEKSIGY